jgi:hypothetical protein
MFMRWIHQPVLVHTLFALTPLVTLVGCAETEAVVIEKTEYSAPAASQTDEFADDIFDASAAPLFVPDRVDSREAKGWTVNLSAAVTKLDQDLLKPDADEPLLKLHANYRDAIRTVQSPTVDVLPSINLIDGKAKQFDDGLYAALEQYWFQERAAEFPGDLTFLKELAAAVPVDSRAAAYFAVGLDLAEIKIPATNQTSIKHFKSRFASDLVQSKPTGFYAWNERLRQCYRVGRFFQMEFELDDNDWMQPVIRALQTNSELQASYRRILARWARLSNTPSRLTALDLADHSTGQDLARFRRQRNLTTSTVSLLPPGSNRETELTRRLFPNGFSARDDIMRELVKAIRSGSVDLQPKDDSGWYDYQVCALETLLVPKRGEESKWLLLTGNYKRRRLEAFQALMTKRKETHVLRSESVVKPESAPLTAKPLEQFSPRLRLEPAPTYYLRMARSYRFLSQALHEFVPEAQLTMLHGLTEQGTRSKPLREELRDIERLFYGFYALSAEDIGLGLNVTEEEQALLGESRSIAEKWLTSYTDDPDIAVDTRVILPVAEDLKRGVISVWATSGIRFSRLKTNYVPEAPPSVRTSETEEWTRLKPEQLSEAIYLLPVDEFVSAQIPSSRILNRKEFQDLCSDAKTKEEIIQRLQR